MNKQKDTCFDDTWSQKASAKNLATNSKNHIVQHSNTPQEPKVASVVDDQKAHPDNNGKPQGLDTVGLINLLIQLQGRNTDIEDHDHYLKLPFTDAYGHANHQQTRKPIAKFSCSGTQTYAKKEPCTNVHTPEWDQDSEQPDDSGGQSAHISPTGHSETNPPATFSPRTFMFLRLSAVFILGGIFALAITIINTDSPDSNDSSRHNDPSSPPLAQSASLTPNVASQTDGAKLKLPGSEPTASSNMKMNGTTDTAPRPKTAQIFANQQEFNQKANQARKHLLSFLRASTQKEQFRLIRKTSSAKSHLSRYDDAIYELKNMKCKFTDKATVKIIKETQTPCIGINVIFAHKFGRIAWFEIMADGSLRLDLDSFVGHSEIEVKDLSTARPKKPALIRGFIKIETLPQDNAPGSMLVIDPTGEHSVGVAISKNTQVIGGKAKLDQLAQVTRPIPALFEVIFNAMENKLYISEIHGANWLRDQPSNNTATHRSTNH